MEEADFNFEHEGYRHYRYNVVLSLRKCRCKYKTGTLNLEV